MGVSFSDLQKSFRKKRNKLLVDLIDKLSPSLRRPVRILDMGGRAVFWDTIETTNIEKITITNIEDAVLTSASERFVMDGRYADALDLSSFSGGKFDLVVSNSVIEHLGTWENIKICAQELRSVAPCGYIQTPSFWFPIEQHFMIPFFHWLPNQIRVLILPYHPRRGYETTRSIDILRNYIEEIDLLTKPEIEFLFPESKILREKFLGLTKSYVAIWELGDGSSYATPS